MAKFAKEDYLEAAEDFKLVTVQYPGSSLADSAQFHIAQCRYRRSEFILAASECDILVKTMPSSPLVPKARYMKAMAEYELSPQSALDQKYTREAIDDFQTFIEYFPADSLSKDAAAKIGELNDKLAKKEMDNANLYFRLEYLSGSDLVTTTSSWTGIMIRSTPMTPCSARHARSASGITTQPRWKLSSFFIKSIPPAFSSRTLML